MTQQTVAWCWSHKTICAPARSRPASRDVTATAPVQLIYVVDLHRLTHTVGFEEPGLHDPEVQKSYYYVDTGLIAQNVYLFAAAHGLAAWFHNCDRTALAQRLGLKARHRVSVCSIGRLSLNTDRPIGTGPKPAVMCPCPRVRAGAAVDAAETRLDGCAGAGC